MGITAQCRLNQTSGGLCREAAGKCAQKKGCIDLWAGPFPHLNSRSWFLRTPGCPGSRSWTSLSPCSPRGSQPWQQWSGEPHSAGLLLVQVVLSKNFFLIDFPLLLYLSVWIVFQKQRNYFFLAKCSSCVDSSVLAKLHGGYFRTDIPCFNSR